MAKAEAEAESDAVQREEESGAAEDFKVLLHDRVIVLWEGN